jgi:hypothetical protein
VPSQKKIAVIYRLLCPIPEMVLPPFSDSLTVIALHKNVPYTGNEVAEDKISLCERQLGEGTEKNTGVVS